VRYPGLNSPIEWCEPPTTDDYGVTTFGTWGGYYIQVMRMIVNHRIVMTPIDNTTGYEHGWCYPTMTAAVLALLAWNPDTDGEPPGYTKRATYRARPAGERAHAYA
jgi:hypothetical protein